MKYNNQSKDNKHKPLEKHDQTNLENDIYQAAHRIDEAVSVNVPEEQWFTQLVSEEKGKIKRSFWTELLLFWITALTVLSLLSASVYLEPFIFIIAQGFISILLISLAITEKNKNKVVPTEQ